MDKYFKNIKKAINDGWDFKNVRMDLDGFLLTSIIAQ